MSGIKEEADSSGKSMKNNFKDHLQKKNMCLENHFSQSQKAN